MFAEFAARTLDGKRKKEVFLCKNKLIIKQGKERNLVDAKIISTFCRIFYPARVSQLGNQIKCSEYFNKNE
jgi:hypothetical protein